MGYLDTLIISSKYYVYNITFLRHYQIELNDKTTWNRIKIIE